MGHLLETFKSIPLYTPEETMEALRNAGDIGYRGPSGSSSRAVADNRRRRRRRRGGVRYAPAASFLPLFTRSPGVFVLGSRIAPVLVA